MALTQPWLKVSASMGIESPARTAEAIARSGSPWFDGHFPGQPILPGIAMIAMAFDAAREKEARQGNSIRLKAVKRVRFKKPVRPDEPFTLTLKREQKESGVSYNFTILLAGEAACTGILEIEPHAGYCVNKTTV
jgi:3-hydroxymyristoyl/3-hydroxydecanoyl-(acyl carrier protein) dehydratase